MKNCENCGKEHDGTFTTGRFCSMKCARGFSTKIKRKDINLKVSLKLKKEKISKLKEKVQIIKKEKVAYKFTIDRKKSLSLTLNNFRLKKM